MWLNNLVYNRDIYELNILYDTFSNIIYLLWLEMRVILRICRFKSQLIFVIKSKYCSIYVFRTSWKCNPGTFSWPQSRWILICWYDHTCRDVFVIRVKWVMTEKQNNPNIYRNRFFTRCSRFYLFSDRFEALMIR